MTYTSHGHHIAGTTTSDEFGQIGRTRCGGQLLCTVCMRDAESVTKALDKGIDVSGLLDAPEVSKDANFISINKVKLAIIGARNNVVSEDKDQITVDDVVVFQYTLTPTGWSVLALHSYITELLFVVNYTLADHTTVVETFTKIEHDIFSQEGN